MKAVMISTDRFVDLASGERPRVWQAVSESGISFTAYIVAVHVDAGNDAAAFSSELAASAPPSRQTEVNIERGLAPKLTRAPKYPLASTQPWDAGKAAVDVVNKEAGEG